MRLKALIVSVHLWLGLTLGALWAIQGLTGAMLVFHRELDQPNIVGGHSAPSSLEALLTAAARTQRSPPESIGLYYPATGLFAVTFARPGSGKVAVIVDPKTQQIVATRERSPSDPRDGNFWRWVYNLHHELLLGERGQWLLGVSGVVLIISALGGAYLAWPRRGQWRAAFATRRWHTRLQKLFGWHRTVGLAAVMALFVLAISGALMDFAKPLRGWAAKYAGFEEPYKATQGPLPSALIGADAAAARARESLPGAELVSVTLPTSKSPVYQVRMRVPREWRSWSGTSQVVIDPAQGEILSTYNAAAAPLVNRVLESAFPVHSGEVAGLLGRLLTLAAGLTLPTFYITGVWIWLRKRNLRTR